MKHNEIVQTINTQTGEIKDGYFVYVAYPKPKIRNTRWMMSFQDSLIEIAKDKELTGETKSVLFFLMGNLEFENYLTIKQVEIAKQLDMQKTNVSRAMKLLVDKGIILKVKDGNTAGYRLNPHYGWKGKVANLEKAKVKIAEDKIIDLQSAREARDLGEIGILVDDIPY